MSEHRVNPELLHRTAWGNPVWNALQSLNIYGFCLVASLVASFIWPLALPACLLFTLITMLVFSLQRWRCPLRMPMTLECADPSQDRMIKRSLFSFWPTLFQYEVILESPASGIFYVGYQRVRDIGRELCAKWHLNRSQFGIRIDHDLASISDHSLASQSITIWHASDH